MSQNLVDCEEIRQLIARYCHLFDDRKSKEWAGLFTDDGIFELGGNRTEGFDALVAFAESLPASAVIRHIATNLVIEVSGDEARSQSYLLVLSPGTPATIGMTSRYDDRLVRVDGAWRFAHRQIVVD